MLTEVGHARPRNAETGDLSPAFWSSVEHNGVTYSGDRGAGVWVTHHHHLPLPAPRPPLEVGRRDDGIVFTAGDTNRIDITVETVEREPGETGGRPESAPLIGLGSVPRVDAGRDAG